MPATKTKQPSLTASLLTESALKELTWRGYEVWRQNNYATPGRKFIGKKGVADIIGFHKHTGVFVMCEVKTKTDHFSVEQIALMLKVKQSGGMAIIATENEKGNVEIIDFDNNFFCNKKQ